MFSSEISSGFVLSNPTNQNTLKNNISTGGGDFSRGRETNGSDFLQNQNQSHGLARYRSAPSSFLAALLDSSIDNNSSSGDESEAFFSALIDGPRDLNQKNGDSDHHQVQYSTKQEVRAETEPRPGLFPNGHTNGYVGFYSAGMENHVHVGLVDNGNSSNLVRQSILPAGNLNGFGEMGEVGNYRVQNHTEACSSAIGFSNHYLNFSAGPSSTSRFMPTVHENMNDSISTISPETGRLRNSNSSWEEPALKRNQDGEPTMFSDCNVLENQNGESRKKPSGLVSHLSLPKTSSEMAAVENYLHFQQETTVPCQIRAKRGCATHPRSIAERMRRTRISDNMKKLQDLFPNMDKQMNRADMLDLAVEYIKDLQKQVQTLTDTKAKCVCLSKPRQASPTT